MSVERPDGTIVDVPLKQLSKGALNDTVSGDQEYKVAEQRFNTIRREIYKRMASKKRR